MPHLCNEFTTCVIKILAAFFPRWKKNFHTHKIIKIGNRERDVTTNGWHNNQIDTFDVYAKSAEVTNFFLDYWLKHK